jgi:DNA-binding MarR family transcriptional regulator
MSDTSEPSKELLRQAVETFWETFPPFWQRVRAHIRQVAVEQFDISVEHFHVLRYIRGGQGSISELAEAKNISRPAISQVVEVLVQKGLIRRTHDARDRRYIQLTLTDSGNALLDAIFDNTREWMMQTLLPLSDEELYLLAQALDSLRKTQGV